jgi:membrane protein required for colicin V production
MPYIDIFILVVVAVFAGKGYFKGFFNEFLTFIGFIIAFFMATNIYKGLGNWIGGLLHISQGLGRFVAFLLIFLVIVFAFTALGSMLSQGAKKLKVTGTNRLLGAVFGAAKGLLSVGVLVTVISRGAFSPGMAAGVKSSFLAPLTVEFFDRAMNLISFVR